jgi:plastocyanin
MARTLLLVLASRAHGVEVPVTVLQLDGAPLAGAVVVAEPIDPVGRARAATVPAPAGLASMDQRELAFVPDVVIVRTGTAVEFPNGDKVRHQVYSFSGAKTFKLALYAGRAHPPVMFDKAGLVTLGCNIHDGMIGYIYVTDSPWSGRTDRQGRVTLDAPDGAYTLRIWHPRSNDAAAQLERNVRIDGSATQAISVKLARKLKPPTHNHGTNQRWDDY